MSRDRQEVIKPGGAEATSQLVREPAVFAEDDALEHGRAIATQPSRNGALQLSSQGVGNATEPAAAPDDLPAVDEEDDVHAVTSKPRPFVEPVLRSARGRHSDERFQDRALRGSPSKRQLQLHGLAQSSPRECRDDRRRAHVVLSAARRPGDGHVHAGGRLEVRRQGTAIERIETCTPPPPADKRERDGQQADTALPARDSRSAAEQRHQSDRERGLDTRDIRRREPKTERAGKELRPVHEQPLPQGATRPRRSSSRAGPIPEIASSSSTEPKAPCCCR